MRRFLIAVEQWAFDDDSVLLTMAKGLLVIGLFFGLLVTPIVLLVKHNEDTAFERCMDSGGAWTVLGSHIQHGFIISGKVMVPTQTRVRDYGCVRVPTPPSHDGGNG